MPLAIITLMVISLPAMPGFKGEIVMTSYQSVQTKQTSASGQAHIIQNDAEALNCRTI